jgi:hypothetical protein
MLHFSKTRELTCTKLAPTCGQKILGLYLYAPCPLLICDARELVVTPTYQGHGAYEEKKIIYRNLVVISYLSLQIWRRQGAYLYMDCSVKKNLNINFLVGCTLNDPKC